MRKYTDQDKERKAEMYESIESLQSENQLLREALEKIKLYINPNNGSYYDGNIFHIINNALNPTP